MIHYISTFVKNQLYKKLFFKATPILKAAIKNNLYFCQFSFKPQLYCISAKTALSRSKIAAQNKWQAI